MYTHRSKEEFIANAEMRIKMREELLVFFQDIIIPAIQSMERKRLGKSFTDTLNKLAIEYNETIFVSNGITYGEFVVEIYKDRLAPSTLESIRFALGYDSKYIIPPTIESVREIIAGFNNTTRDIQLSIDNYDQYVEVAKELQDAITKYKKLPHAFRNNISNFRYQTYLPKA